MLGAWMDRHMAVKKAISITALFAFCTCFFPLNAQAAVDAAQPSFKMPVTPAYDQFASLDTDTFTIPEHLGEVKYAFKGNPDKVIIHIQDAHCNAFAQNKIAGIIDYLNKEYGINMINLEGGDGNYDLAIFTSISGDDIRREVADYFVEKGEINGAELYAINNPERVTLWGIEDKDLYLKNLKVYRDSLKYRAEVDKFLNELTHILNNLKRHIYTPELLRIDKAYNAYKAGDMDFRGYLKFLIVRAKEGGIQVRQFANLYLLVQAMELEEKIDFKKANKERTALVDELKSGLSKNELRELIVKSIDFKTKKISRKVFYDFLLKKAKELGVKIDRFPALSSYIVYVTIFESVDRAKVMEELDEFEVRIKEPLYRNDTQRRLDVLSRNLALMKNIFEIMLTKTDYQYYLNNKSYFDVSNYLEFIRKEAPKYKITARPSADITKLDGYRENIAQFYEYSFKRDEAFLRNIRFTEQDQEMVPGNVKSAILMTGGFHTDNLCELFRKNNISYVSILPKFTTAKDFKNNYFDLLAGETTDVQRMMTSALAKTAMMEIASKLNAALGDAVWGKANMDAFRVAVWIREQIARGRKIEKITVDEKTNIVTFNMEDGSKVEMPLRSLMDIVHQRDVDGQMDRLSKLIADGRIEEKEAFEDMEQAELNVILDDIKEFLKSIGASEEVLGWVEELKEKKIKDTAAIRLVHGITFRGHAGGRGVRINGNLRQNQLIMEGVIVHEIIAGLFGDHFLAQKVENAFVRGLSGERILAGVTPLPAPIWDMTLEERLMADRDFIAAEEAEEAEPVIAEKMPELAIVSEGGSLIIDAELPMTSMEDDEWDGMIKGTKDIFGQMLDECARGLFGDDETMINIGISSEKTGQPLPVVFSKATLVKSKLNGRFRKYKLGKITINIFNDDVDEMGVNHGLNAMKEDLAEMRSKMGAKTRTRVVTFMFSKDTEVSENTYTVYLGGTPGETAVPVDACGMAGLAILNYFDRAEKAGGENQMSLDAGMRARMSIARGLAAISGRYDQASAAAIVESIVKDGMLISSGILLIKIRPIDTDEIVEYYEAAAAVVRSL